MGFSAPPEGIAGGDNTVALGQQDPNIHLTPKKPSFGDQLMSHYSQKYPMAGGLADIVFGQNSPTAQAAPQPQMEQPAQPDYSQMIAANAQPKQSGGGLDVLLKLIGG